MTLPHDPVILLSFVNTQLRDFYGSLDDFCSANDCDKEEIADTLSSIAYVYDSQQNQFV